MKHRQLTRTLLAMTAGLAILCGAAGSADAAKGDCGQPFSDGAQPIATDALFIMNVAVGGFECPTRLKTCDVDGNCSVTATDALTTMRIAIDQTGELLCNCEREPTTSTSMTSTTVFTTTTTLIENAGCHDVKFLFSIVDSDVDNGWNGLSHDTESATGIQVPLDLQRRCSQDNELCRTKDDCAGQQSCRSSCDCSTSPLAPPCQLEVAASSRCIGNMSERCESDVECSERGDSCEQFVGPPQPVVYSGVPLCATRYLEDGERSFLFDPGQGETSLKTTIRSRLHLGIDDSRPCPQCGVPVDAPEVGGQFTCNGGINDAAACTVEAVSKLYGGTSRDCPPDPTANISGAGVSTPIDARTALLSKTATMPCGGSLAAFHPDNTAQTVCIDDGADCSSNNDCAPGVSCGLYCHCGFCDSGSGPNPLSPCWNDSDCADGSCSSVATDENLSQRQPNDCNGLICGAVQPETCCSVDDGEACDLRSPLVGTCDVIPSSCDDDFQCAAAGHGTTCLLDARSCFEGKITRTGSKSPGSGRCLEAEGTPPCVVGEDCASGQCTPDHWTPVLAAVSCTSGSASSVVNSITGRPGPVAMLLDSRIDMCRCSGDLADSSATCKTLCGADAD